MERIVVIKNEKGLHIRPAGEIVKTVNKFKSQVEILYNGKKANARSVMILMSLGAKQNDEVTIVANGEDAEEALKAVAELFDSGFSE